MTRLYIVVEGHTERAFVLRVLAPHLDARGVYTSPVLVTTRRDRSTGQKLGRGGGHWKHWLTDVQRIARQQSQGDVRITTLFDLYGLPDDFPSLGACSLERDTIKRAELLEQAMAAAVNDRRFLPYLQRHEIEALVLACLDSLSELMKSAPDAKGIAKLRKDLGQLAPEDVDDGVVTAPSKRLEKNIPAYDKATHGPDAMELAGLEAIRAACPRFNAWLTQLEQLASGAAVMTLTPRKT